MFFASGSHIANLKDARDDLAAAQCALTTIMEVAGERQIVLPVLRGGFLPWVVRESGATMLQWDEFAKAREEARIARENTQALREPKCSGKTARNLASGAIARRKENAERRAADNRARCQSSGGGGGNSHQQSSNKKKTKK